MKSDSKNQNRFSPISTESFFNNKTTGPICSFHMVSKTMFSVDMSRFCQKTIDVFKTIPSRSYDPKIRQWSFHLKDYDLLISSLRTSNPENTILGIPTSFLTIFKKHMNEVNENLDIDLSSIDPQLLKSLMPFQREGVCYGISKKGRCIIADDMGLGKTIQALGIAHYYKNTWPLLIVSPASVRYQWSDAIFKFLPSVSTHYVLQFSSSNDYFADAKIVITTYENLIRHCDKFRNHLFGFIILDESHVLKNEKTARFKATKDIVSAAKHVILLSGTPALSRPIELFPQISLVTKFIGLREYGSRYCAGCKRPFGYDYSGHSNMEELQILLKALCMIRRLKGDTLIELLPKKRQIVLLNPDLIKAGTEKMKDCLKQLNKTSLKPLEKQRQILEYYNESSGCRLKAVCVHVANLLEEGKKFLVFAHHQLVLNEICNLATKMKIKFIRIDGKTNSDQRKQMVDNFQEQESIQLAVLSITAANSGITLTAAQLVVFAELFWNPGILCQAEDRVHRIGQNNFVLIQYLVAKGTADDYIWPLIKKKMNVLNGVGLDSNFSFKEISTTTQSIKEQSNLDAFLSQTFTEAKGSESPIKLDDEMAETNDMDELILNICEEDFNSNDWDDLIIME
ncbi:SWI/SNF-related matrix-associated actin-dependent regulator of chromatin subfamily A-like protein 1 isoform X2 [Prorops nasuta]